MGLSASAYRQLTKVDALFDADGYAVNPTTRERYDENLTYRAFSNPDFPSRIEGLEHHATYLHGGRIGGWNASYGRYNAWRERLAKMAGYPAVPYERLEGFKDSTVVSHQVGASTRTEGPFLELCCFSDCEGTIGPVACAKLAKDFAEWDDRAKAFGDDGFYDHYSQWRELFEFAADGGAVNFG